MRSFTEFVEHQQDAKFEAGVSALVSPVVEGLISFDELVEDVILPVFSEDTFLENEQDVLNEFLGRMFGRKQQAQPQVDPRKAAAREQAAEKLNNHVQQLIQQQLVPVINKITDSMKQSAFQNNDRRMFNAAKLFNQKLMKSAAGIKFAIKGHSSPEQRAAFSQERAAAAPNLPQSGFPNRLARPRPAAPQQQSGFPRPLSR